MGLNQNYILLWICTIAPSILQTIRNNGNWNNWNPSPSNSWDDDSALRRWDLKFFTCKQPSTHKIENCPFPISQKTGVVSFWKHPSSTGEFPWPLENHDLSYNRNRKSLRWTSPHLSTFPRLHRIELFCFLLFWKGFLNRFSFGRWRWDISLRGGLWPHSHISSQAIQGFLLLRW